MYLAGGEFPDGSASREMWRYDSCFDSWLEMAHMNVARSELGEATAATQIQVGIISYKDILLWRVFNLPKDRMTPTHLIQRSPNAIGKSAEIQTETHYSLFSSNPMAMTIAVHSAVTYWHFLPYHHHLT